MPAAAAVQSATPATSLYVHVPFCVVKCGYCDFHSYVERDETVHDRFLAVLAAELQSSWRGGRPSSVFIGGGTPSLLSEARLAALLELLDRVVDLHGCPEVSMEANPESITAAKVRLARERGVRRFSMGVQSFHPRHLQFLDRAHSGERAEQAFAELRAGGADNVSVDLMFGIPGQTEQEWVDDLERALRLGPDHLSCYNLTFEQGTRLHRDMQRGITGPNDSETDRAMFLHTRHRLAAAGFDAYEVSNFAGRGGPCRHNDHYWLQGDYVGIGPGASSHRAGVRWTNLKATEAWAAAAVGGTTCAGSAETLRPLQRAAEAVWLGIRRRDGIELPAIERRIGVSLIEPSAALRQRHIDLGWVDWDGSRLRLTGEGLLLADQVGGDYLGMAAAD